MPLHFRWGLSPFCIHTKLCGSWDVFLSHHAFPDNTAKWFPTELLQHIRTRVIFFTFLSLKDPGSWNIKWFICLSVCFINMWDTGSLVQICQKNSCVEWIQLCLLIINKRILLDQSRPNILKSSTEWKESPVYCNEGNMIFSYLGVSSRSL